MGGVKIAEGSVIGAGSVVNHKDTIPTLLITEFPLGL